MLAAAAAAVKIIIIIIVSVVVHIYFIFLLRAFSRVRLGGWGLERRTMDDNLLFRFY